MKINLYHKQWSNLGKKIFIIKKKIVFLQPNKTYKCSHVRLNTRSSGVF